jgi:hypothetical protein
MTVKEKEEIKENRTKEKHEALKRAWQCVLYRVYAYQTILNKRDEVGKISRRGSSWSWVTESDALTNPFK